MKDHFIASNQFPIQITPHLFMLGNYFFNLFLIQGKRASALFEVGISAVVDSVVKQLGKLNIAPDFIICSHPHSDHITGLPGLIKAFPKAIVMAAQEAQSFVEHPKAGPLLIKEDAFMSKSLANFGIRPGRPPLESVPDLSCADLVEKNRTINLGGVSIVLKKVQGHSPGNLIGLIPDQKILFSSDSLGFHFPGRGFLPLFFTGADSYLSVLQDIQQFSPAVVCPAHQGPITGSNAAGAIELSLDTTIGLIKKIKGSDDPDATLADQIFTTHYRDEFTLYTKDNIKNCSALLVKRAHQSCLSL